MTRDRARFDRLDASTLRFPGGDSEAAVALLTPRIVRVELTQTGHGPAPSYVPDREWAPTPFDVVDGDPVRLLTPDLQVEVGDQAAPHGLSRSPW